jgi:hypothetical protein
MAVQFDARKSYIIPSDEHASSGDGREIDLLYYIYNESDVESLRGDPLQVIDAIDEFGRSKEYLMNIGYDKGKTITRLIEETRPNIMVLPHFSETNTVERIAECEEYRLSWVDTSGIRKSIILPCCLYIH